MEGEREGERLRWRGREKQAENRRTTKSNIVLGLGNTAEDSQCICNVLANPDTSHSYQLTGMKVH